LLIQGRDIDHVDFSLAALFPPFCRNQNKRICSALLPRSYIVGIWINQLILITFTLTRNSFKTMNMNFDLNKSIEILQRSPAVLEDLLKDISNDWVLNNEGKDTFSPFDVVGHLVHGEKNDWIQRMEIILSGGPDKTFQPFDRFAQFEESKGKSMNQLLIEFKLLRQQNMKILKSKNLSAADFTKTGIHPKFGIVTLQQLLATWTVHDLSHIAQITRVMCKHYKQDVGPWIEFLPILTRR
jgi:hypothetical protein